MATVSGFEEIADELEEIASAFDRMQSRKGTEMDAHGAIEEGVSTAMEREVVPQARAEARQYVPSGHENTIDHEEGEWYGDRYRHHFYSTSDLVAYHEFGTGTHGSGNGGYRITPNGDYPIAIPAHRWNGPSTFIRSTDQGEYVFFEYVWHPGVEEQRFMRDALEDNAQEMRGYILSKINEMFRKNDIK